MLRFSRYKRGSQTTKRKIKIGKRPKVMKRSLMPSTETGKFDLKRKRSKSTDSPAQEKSNMKRKRLKSTHSGSRNGSHRKEADHQSPKKMARTKKKKPFGFWKLNRDAKPPLCVDKPPEDYEVVSDALEVNTMTSAAGRVSKERSKGCGISLKHSDRSAIPETRVSKLNGEAEPLLGVEKRSEDSQDNNKHLVHPSRRRKINLEAKPPSRSGKKIEKENQKVPRVAQLIKHSERKKLNRWFVILKKKLKSLDEFSSEFKEVLNQIEAVREDIFYIKNFPLDNYFPLLVSAKKETPEEREFRLGKIAEIKASLRDDFQAYVEANPIINDVRMSGKKPNVVLETTSVKKRHEEIVISDEEVKNLSNKKEHDSQLGDKTKEVDEQKGFTDDLLQLVDDDDQEKIEDVAVTEEPTEERQYSLEELMENKELQKKLLTRNQRKKLGILKARRNKKSRKLLL